MRSRWFLDHSHRANWFLIKGSGLADGKAVTTTTPLLQQLAGAAVYMGYGFANLLYADSGQLIGQVPLSVPANTSQQILLQRDNSLGIPSAVIVAAAQPAVFVRPACQWRR